DDDDDDDDDMENKDDKKDDDDDNDNDDHDHNDQSLIKNRKAVVWRLGTRRCFMIKQMEKKFVNGEFQGIKERVDKVLYDIMDKVLYDIIPKISLNDTNDLIDDNLPRVVADVVKKEREASKLLYQP
nr:hypothetical protein [Tanacetum cinerariifolium]